MNENHAGKINAHILPLAEIFKEPQLKIPEYQRPYTWKAKNIIRLLEDTRAAMTSNTQRYRAGTVIIHNDDEGKHNIVDGQQRLVSLTLILHCLRFTGPMPLAGMVFKHVDSKNNIKFNYDRITEWLDKILPQAERSRFLKYLLEHCEFVIVRLSRIDEAFQLFDAQNARGVALEPYDLLKAFHLREMKMNAEQEKLDCVKKWEAAVNEGLLNNLGKYLYRIRKWARDEYAYEFSKEDIDEFKGVNIHEHKNFPYLKPYLINEAVTSEIREKPITNLFLPNLLFPFQLTQLIINGKLFFEYVGFYTELYRHLFKTPGSALYDFYEAHCLYEGSNRIGDKYVRELFEAAVLYYADKFGEAQFAEVYTLLYKWAYILRLGQTRVQYNSIDKFVKITSDNVFKKICNAYYPSEVRQVKLHGAAIVYSIPEVEQVIKPNN